MNINSSRKPRLKFIQFVFGLFLLSSHVNADPPILRFPEEISWKGVFDNGLRPKHVLGLERKLTECELQELQVAIGHKPHLFFLDSGLLSIELMDDDRIRLFEHISRVPVSMEEGENRLNHFRELFSTGLVRPGTIPAIMDERRGGVMSSSDQYAIAKIGNHAFTYGFTPSYQKEKPLLAVFQLAWIRPESEPRQPIRRKIVEPPQGYEWYSLDPKVHTPDPAVEVEELPDDASPRAEPLGKAEPEPTESAAQRTRRGL